MAQSVILLTHDEDATKMAELVHAEAGNRLLAVNKVQTYLGALASGARKATAVVGVGAVKASGTLTGSTVVATDTAVINGVTFAAVASGATGNQFNVGADDTATMANLAAKINASATALISGYVTASASGAVVTVTATKPGKAGNCMTLTATGAITASGSGRLTSGSDGTEKTHTYGGA